MRKIELAIIEEILQVIVKAKVQRKSVTRAIAPFHAFVKLCPGLIGHEIFYPDMGYLYFTEHGVFIRSF
jgi:hypothetical protein